MMRFTSSSGRQLPGADWKGVHEDERHNDAVFFHEDDAVAKMMLGLVCDFHPNDTFCIRCLPRLEAAVSAARRALDPEAAPLIKVIETQEDQPRYIALVNAVSEQAFGMRLDHPNRITAHKLIFTSTKRQDRFERSIPVMNYKVETSVCDATYMRAFYVRLGPGLTEEYTKRLWEARFSLRIDGEPMAVDRPLRELLGQKEVVLPPPIKGRGCLFEAHTITGPDPDVTGGNKSVETDDWIGYMLPHGTIIDASLDRVPAGGGLVELEVGWTLGVYTTRAATPPQRTA